MMVVGGIIILTSNSDQQQFHITNCIADDVGTADCDHIRIRSGDVSCSNGRTCAPAVPATRCSPSSVQFDRTKYA